MSSISNGGSVNVIVKGESTVNSSSAVSSNDSVNVKIKKNPSVIVNQTASVPVRSIDELGDVDLSDITDGALLIYEEEREKFIVSTLLEKQTVNGGHF